MTRPQLKPRNRLLAAWSNLVYRTILNKLTGHNYYVQEIECNAITQANECRFLFQRV